MFCYQCQETAGNTGCTKKGVCGKTDNVANLQDLLIDSLRTLAMYSLEAKGEKSTEDVDVHIIKGLFTTVTNVNFDASRIAGFIRETRGKRDALRNALLEEKGAEHVDRIDSAVPDPYPADSSIEQMELQAEGSSILREENEDIRSLRELLLYGVKGIAAYADHASVLGSHDSETFSFVKKALAATVDKDADVNTLLGMVVECGKTAVDTMALLDQANTGAYGNPEPTQVDLGVGNNPGILVSGHDLKDLEELLEQSKGKGVDIYTHGEMLPAQSYPAFKKYDHFAGNYGGSWYRQKAEFASFNGPILMTTNCLMPPKDNYRDRLFTTGLVGFENVVHIPDRESGQQKDFSAIIDMALTCEPPQQLEEGHIPAGFAHNTVISIADKVIDAVKNGSIRKFIVMAGCDGRQPSREYFEEVAEKLPADTVILTAGCAKYRYNKLPLGDIGGIPRVLDAGQCNDSYSLVRIALALKDAFGLDDINQLPIAYDIAWYEQKAVTVLLALLYLGVKGIRLGPTLPAFVSPGVLDVLVDKFGIKPVSDPETDINEMLEMSGQAG